MASLCPSSVGYSGKAHSKEWFRGHHQGGRPVPENDQNGEPSARLSSEICIVRARNDINGRLPISSSVKLCWAYDGAHRNRNRVILLCPKAAVMQTDAARSKKHVGHDTVTETSRKRAGGRCRSPCSPVTAWPFPVCSLATL
jgi:hypothetical protein